MSVSSLIGTPIPVLPQSSSSRAVPAQFNYSYVGSSNVSGFSGLMIECSSRPKKKATAHHKKTRPRKSQPWDIRRKPTVYPPLPVFPPEWTLVSSASDEADGDAASASPSAPELVAPIASG